MPATVAGASETMSARSRFGPLFEPLPVPSRLMSQKTPLARKPCGATIEPLMDLNFSFIWQSEMCGRGKKFSITKRGKCGAKIFRPWRFAFYVFAGLGMHEGNLAGVQHLARCGHAGLLDEFFILARAINRIA